jgi:hypothetical protein
VRAAHSLCTSESGTLIMYMAPSSQDAGPMGVNPMALLGQEGAQKDYYYYYYYVQVRAAHSLCTGI